MHDADITGSAQNLPEKASSEDAPCAEQMRMRKTNSSDAESLAKSPPFRNEKEVGAWLPEHAQRIIKRHLGTAGETERALQNGCLSDKACDLPSDIAVVDSADIAGGIAADDAAAGDAAVMALVVGKRAPAISSELQQLPDQIKQGSPTALPECSPSNSNGSCAQYFNLCESDPDYYSMNEEAEKVHHWLRNLGLGRYFDQLSAEGFDDMAILATLEEKHISELLEMCPMPMLHEQQLRRGLAKLRSGDALPP